MAAQLRQEDRMAIESLSRHGVGNREIGRKLGVTEGSVRYHARRQAQGAVDGRSRQASSLEPLRGEIEAWRQALGGGPVNLLDLHAWLRDEHGFGGSTRAVQRFYTRAYPRPRRRARRRVTTRRRVKSGCTMRSTASRTRRRAWQRQSRASVRARRARMSAQDVSHVEPVVTSRLARCSQPAAVDRGTPTPVAMVMSPVSCTRRTSR